jgi:hypothetical protein
MGSRLLIVIRSLQEVMACMSSDIQVAAVVQAGASCSNQGSWSCKQPATH